MLRIAFVKDMPGEALDDPEFVKKVRTWFNDLQPAGLKTVSIYRAIGMQAQTVYIFKSNNSREIDKLIEYWREFPFEISLGLDWGELFSLRGLQIVKQKGKGPLYLAVMKNIPQWALDDQEFLTKARTWFNDRQPAGFETVGLYRVVGTNAPTLHVFTAQNHEDVDTFVSYWRECVCEVSLAVDWREQLQRRGVSVV